MPERAKPTRRPGFPQRYARAGGVLYLAIIVLYAVPLLWIEYLLLRPVSKLFLLAVMPTLSGGDQLHTFAPQQLELLAQFALKSHDIAFSISLIFFGCTCLVNGYLIFKSGYFPKLIGILMELAGFSYLVACFAALFAPAVADLIIPAILLPPLIGESSFCLWLLVKGVNIAKWDERSGAAAGVALP